MTGLAYTVKSMTGSSDKGGSCYELKLESRSPGYQCTIVAVSEEQFKAVKVGDKITLILTVAGDEETGS